MPTAMRHLLAFLLFLLLIPAWAGQVYTLSVVPQFTPADIGLRWLPVLNHLEKETGISVQLRLQENIPKFESDLLAGIPDLVFLNPYHMVLAKKRLGYLPMVRSGNPINGILVVARGGPIRTVADLNGKTLAFPSPNAFGASLFMRALLTEKEHIDFTPIYVGSHQNVYRSVLLGDALAGGGISNTLNMEPVAVQSRLTVLYSTPPVASHPLAAHPRVPEEVRERVKAALLKLDRDPAGHKLLAAVELEHIQPADFQRDYAPLERLKLDRYAKSEQTGGKK
jgi:phosphonate transport system substrate-binding protein